MSTRYLKIARVAALGFGLAAIASGEAMAQGMDMSWAIRSQARNQAIGDYMARATAMRCYQMLQQARAMGATGPLNCGTTTDSMRQSINRANQAGIAYNRAQAANSVARSNAVGNWDIGAVRGQAAYVDPTTGAKTYLPNYSPPGQIENYGGNSYTQDAQGTYWRWAGNDWVRMDSSPR